MTQQLQNIIDTAWEQRADISPNSASAELRDAVAHVLAGLDDGSLQVTVSMGQRGGDIGGGLDALRERLTARGLNVADIAYEDA